MGGVIVDVKRLSLILAVVLLAALGAAFALYYLFLSSEPYFEGAYFHYTVVSSTLIPPEGSSYSFKVEDVWDNSMRVTLEVVVGSTTASSNYLAEKSWKGLLSKIFEGKKISYEYHGKERITVKNTLIECEKYVSEDTAYLGIEHTVTVYVYKKVPVLITETYDYGLIEASATIVLTGTNSIKIP
ncbi:MAG: hypothetical protein QXI11_04220 [Thermoproteota archaeon]